MTKYTKIIVGLLCSVTLLSGCASHSGNGASQDQDAAADSSTAVESSTAESSAAAEGAVTEETEGTDHSSAGKTGDEAAGADGSAAASTNEHAGEKVYLDYIDAWDEWHTMEVDPTVRENIYDAKKFVVDANNTQWVTYSDPDYTVLQGVDVSEHQGLIDWKAVADAGYSFAFIRVGYRGYGESGKLCEDYHAIENLRSAKEAGLKVGTYFFSQALNEEEAREEAELAVRMIDESGVQQDLPLMYDPELIKDDVGRANDITREQVALNTEAFRETVESISDYKADIYSNLPWEHELFDAETLNNFDIWYADYENPPQTPYHFVWWQYTNKGSVPGIEGAVDLDLWIVR